VRREAAAPPPLNSVPLEMAKLKLRPETHRDCAINGMASPGTVWHRLERYGIAWNNALW